MRVCVIETFAGPNSVTHRPTTWQCVHLHGSAAEVIVALSETVPARPLGGRRGQAAQPHSSVVAIRAPSRNASNFAQITVGWTSGR